MTRTYKVVFRRSDGKRFVTEVRAESEADAILAAKQEFRDQERTMKAHGGITTTAAVPVSKD